MFSYALRDLLRNPRRTLASVTGVALAVGLFASITFLVDASAARMTERAIAPVAIDMQAGLSSPLTSPLGLTESLDGGASLAAGQMVTVTLVAVNNSYRPMTGLVLRDTALSQLAALPGSTTLNGSPVADVGGESPLSTGLRVAGLAPAAKITVAYRAKAVAAVPSTQALSLQGRSLASRSRPPGPPTRPRR